MKLWGPHFLNLGAELNEGTQYVTVEKKFVLATKTKTPVINIVDAR